MADDQPSSVGRTPANDEGMWHVQVRAIEPNKRADIHISSKSLVFDVRALARPDVKVSDAAHTLMHDFKHLPERQALEDVGVKQHDMVWVVGWWRGLPPYDCCCFDLHSGVMIFTQMFIFLQVVGILFAAALITVPAYLCLTSTMTERGGNYECEPWLVPFAAGLGTIILLWNLVQLLVGIYGSRAIDRCDTTGLKYYLYAQLAFLVLTAILEFGVTTFIYAFYVYAVKVLRDQVQFGEITAQRKQGPRPGPPSGAAIGMVSPA